MSTSPFLRIVHLLQGLVERLAHRSRSERDAVADVESVRPARSKALAEESQREGGVAPDQGLAERSHAGEADEERSPSTAAGYGALDSSAADEVLAAPVEPDADVARLVPPPEHVERQATEPLTGASSGDQLEGGATPPSAASTGAGSAGNAAPENDIAPVHLSDTTGADDDAVSASAEGAGDEEPASQSHLSTADRPRPRLRQLEARPVVVRPREPARPSGHSVLPARYRAWNRALAEYCLSRPSGAAAYLTVTPQVLAAAWLEAFEEANHPEQAAADLAVAVSDAYTTYALEEPQRLWVLSAIPRESGPPDSIAFLALSVLAAYEMHADEEAGPNAFYIRLADLLEVERIGEHPRGFNTQDFEALWQHLHDWTRRNEGVALAMPADPGTRRFLALPLTHAPLRKMDVEKLPAFFAWASYEAGARADVELLGRDLVAWERARSPLSRAGAAALADDRLSAVAAQVALELEAWDGRFGDTAGRRSASVQLQLDFVRRQPLLYYLARRPSEFPPRFDDGPHVFEAGEEGWYDPVVVPRDAGHELAAGFSWTMEYGSASVELRRAAAGAIALAPAREMTGFVSRRGLAGHLPCAVLCRDELLRTAQDYLSAVAQRRCQPLQHESVPDGWVLFPNVVPLRHEVVPEGLEALEVGFAVEIVPVGGLRLGAARWLAGAAPRVFIGGEQDSRATRIDGEEVVVLADGRLDDGGRLSRPGRHFVEAGVARRRIDIVEPELNTSACASLVEDAAADVVALPSGSAWTIIGAQIGDVAQPDVSTFRGALARVTFEPQWALSTAEGQGATALLLSNGRLRPSVGSSTGSVALTAEQFQTLDEIAASQPEAKVVGVAGELIDEDAHRAAVVPIIRDASGSLHVLTAEGTLVDAADPTVVLHPDSPVLKWASAIYDAGLSPVALGSALDDRDEPELEDFWAAYYEAAMQFEPLLRRLHR